MRRALWLTTLVLACGEGATPEPAADAGAGPPPEALDSAPVPRDTAALEPPDTGAAAGGWNLGPIEAPGGGGVATLVAVRVAGHPGYDRIVFEFGADPVPGYRIRTMDGPATRCGSGESVPRATSALLEVSFEPARAHTDEGAATVAERSLRPALPLVRTLELTCDFEAHVDWVAGLVGEPLLRVAVLREPNRLVLDLTRPDAPR